MSVEVTSLFYWQPPRGYRLQVHTHRDYEWYGVVEGGIEAAIGEESHRLGPYQAILVPPDVPRTHRERGRTPRILVATFRNRGLRLGACLDRVLTAPPDLHADLHALVDELSEPRDVDAEALRQALLVRLLIGLRRAAGRAPSRQSDLVRHVEAYMRANLAWSITREDLARAVNLSPPHLARVYRAAAGKTLGRRLNELRMVRAKSMLLESTMSVTRIALLVGFNSFSHFSKTFRRETGRTPSDFRRRAPAATSGS
ncbi:MAG: helix-turn-helix domain-containing protein [Planctomycetota bacterium]|jgi:AraC-like DNA-binding protein